jgi:isocitrate dehydrogenase (NAD+)
MAHRVTMIPGDGIGPEVVEAARRAIDATGVAVAWDRHEMGSGAFARTGEALPPTTVEAIRASGVALKGPVDTPVTSGERSLNLRLRKQLDLFANVRPCRLYPGVPSPYGSVDLVVVRENLEGSYTGIEFEMGTPATKELIRFIEDTTGRRVREDSGLSVKTISDTGTERIVRFAFAEARRRNRGLVTAAHKANIMKFSDGLFLEVARRVAADEAARRVAADEAARRVAADEEIRFEDRIIDALCMQLIQAPERFEVLVLPNLYGDIVAELAAGLIGGTGVAPGGLFGGDGGRELAVFEATHGTAPALAGTNRADPLGLILSGAMMLQHLGEAEAAERLEAAVADVLADGTLLPYDLRAPDDDRPAAGTFAVTDAVIARL